MAAVAVVLQVEFSPLGDRLGITRVGVELLWPLLRHRRRILRFVQGLGERSRRRILRAVHGLSARSREADDRHAIVLQDPSDLGRLPGQDGFQFFLERLALLLTTHAHRDVVHKGQERQIDRRRYRYELELHPLLPGEIARDRAPDDRDIDFAHRHGVDDRGRRVLFAVVAVHAVADHVLHDLPLPQGVGGRAVRIIVPDRVNADLELAQNRVIERADLEPAVFPIEKDIGGAVVGLGRQDKLVAAGNAHHHITGSLPQCVPDEAASLRPPGVTDASVQFRGDQLRDLVLEPFLPPIGIGKVVRVGADPELPGLIHSPLGAARHDE